MGEDAKDMDGRKLRSAFRSQFLLDRSSGAISDGHPSMAGLICQNRTKLCHRATGAKWMRVQNLGSDWTEWLPFENVSLWASELNVPVLVQYHAAQSASFVVGDCVSEEVGKPCLASWHSSMYLRGEMNDWSLVEGAMEKVGHFT